MQLANDIVLAICLPQTDNSNVKRPRPTALKDGMHHLGRVDRFTPNPALPTDQPLRGSWRDHHSFTYPHLVLKAWHLITSSHTNT